VLTLEIFASPISVLSLIKQKSHQLYLQVSYQLSTLFSFNIPNLICSDLLWRAPIFCLSGHVHQFPLNILFSSEFECFNQPQYAMSWHCTNMFLFSQSNTNRWFSACCCWWKIWGTLL